MNDPIAFEHYPVDALMRVTQRPEAVFVRGSGSWLWDSTGRRYLDGFGGILRDSLSRIGVAHRLPHGGDVRHDQPVAVPERRARFLWNLQSATSVDESHLRARGLANSPIGSRGLSFTASISFGWT